MISKVELFALMKKGALVITPNNRLSSELLFDFYQHNTQPIQVKPHCFPYSFFLQDLFRSFCHLHPKKKPPLVLNSQQLHYLWQQVLSSNIYMVNHGLIQRVNEAWTRCHAWLLDYNHPLFTYNEQTTLFQSWAKQLEEKLTRLEAISEAQLASYLYAQEGVWEKKTLVWACFDDFTPQQKMLQQFLIQQGCEILHYDLVARASECYQHEAPDQKDELEQLVLFLKVRLALGEKQIGVVVPSLETKAQSLRRTFLHHFKQEQFNISLGQPLTSYPLIAHALMWINLAVIDRNFPNSFSLQQVRLLLHSPYLDGAQSEMLSRSRFLEENSLVEQLQIEKSDLINALTSTAPRLAQVLSQIEPYPEQASPQTWVKLFIHQLKILGFPGETVLSSTQYQCYQRFLRLLEEFSQLELMTSSMQSTEALSTLNHLASSTVFQAQQLSHAPIQILGLLEAAGCHFDSLWVLDLTEQHLPQAPRLSPFIPASLQRQHQMPHATPERELFLAETMIKRLFNASPYNVFSYPRLQGEKLNRASPLINHLPHLNTINTLTEADQANDSPFSDTRSNPYSFEYYHEDYFIPLSPEEKTSGGTTLIANQAKCPFKAFAAHRLHIRTKSGLSDGLDSKTRGLLIHRIMELLWKDLKSQKNLLLLSKHDLDKLINDVIDKALQSLVTQKKQSLPALVYEVETSRLKALVQAEIDWEQQRDPFEVEALEAPFSISLGELTLQMRVDRLDQFEDGRKEILDYKSRLPNNLPWNEERPKEPQLLLYALIDSAIQSLLFIALKEGRLACRGLSQAESTLVGIQSLKKNQTWSELRQQWHTHLLRLADEFTQGQCIPKPLNKTICQSCDYQSLCRYK